MRKGLQTKLIHLPDSREEGHLLGSISPPLFQTSTFIFDSAESGGRRFAGEESGYIYTRLGNPTVRLFEESIAELEGGEDAAAFSSGMGAISAVMLALVHSGDHVLVSQGVYGCTYGLLEFLKNRFQVDYTLADLTDESSIRAQVRENTRVIYVETPINPTMELVDLAASARAAKEVGARLVVDNTFATPVLQKPIEHGADVVVHSATKYLGGHGDVIFGCAVGTAEFIGEVRRTTQKDFGGIAAPFDAWLVLRGMKTLGLRMDRHNASAKAVVEWLQKHPAVEQVYYPGCTSTAQNLLFQRQMLGGGGVVGFVLKGGLEGGIRFMNALTLCKRAVSLGEVHTLVEHPASMTHSGIPADVRHQMKIADGLIRLAVGLEDVEDILADLDTALQASQR
ncbi:MAG: PLP-dependent aspartate aminotransferase family protein [Alicyclobacillaceae bacterium]|nr:PLP-dependent aspartate aminotransferase family protein [Alicyclobacillaceae bacterium]